MAKLVEICIHFIATKLNEVVWLPIDMSCLSDKLLDKLAESVSIDSLSSLKDKKDKLESKLYSRKVQEFVAGKGK